MTIRIELTREEEAQLRSRATRCGQEPERLAGDLLRSLLLRTSNDAQDSLPPVVDEHGVFHEDRWDRVMASITRGTTGAPVPPASALTREALYEDHD